MENEAKYKWLAIGLAGVALIWVIYKVLFSIGLIKTNKERAYSESKDLAESDLMQTDFFSPKYYIGKKVSKTKATINSLADTFYKAVRFYGTDESKLSGVFSSLKYKTDVSFLAEAYLNKYKEDFRDRLISELDKKEMFNLIQQLKQLK